MQDTVKIRSTHIVISATSDRNFTSSAAPNFLAMVELLVNHWPEMLGIIDRHEWPFSFKITMRSSRPEAF